MSDALKHECGVALVVLRKPPEHYAAKYGMADYGGVKLSLMLEKQHNRGQDGVGAAIMDATPTPGEPPFRVFKSASDTALADVLGMIGNRNREKGRIFLGHLRYATFGKNDIAFCHPFVHEASELARTLVVAGNFNLTNASALFEEYGRSGSFPTSHADGYLITELVARELAERPLAQALDSALRRADGAWTLVGATGDGRAFALRDPHGIRPGYFYVDDEAVAVASERPAIQAAFDVLPEAVKELPPGVAMVASPEGNVAFCELDDRHSTADNHADSRLSTADRPPRRIIRPCSFERIYFSRANDADIHRERKALGAALAGPILREVGNDLENTFFSYIPNSAQVAFHGLLEALWTEGLAEGRPVRFGQVAVKDAKFRTFIADAAARREIGKHVYDVTYGLVRPGSDTLVVLDDSIVRGNTMRNAILPMLDRLGPKRIIVASSAPPIRYPDCYGIDMSTLGELVAFRALENLLGDEAEAALHAAMEEMSHAESAESESHAENAEFLPHAGGAENAETSSFAAKWHPSFAPQAHPSFVAERHSSFAPQAHPSFVNPLAALYARFTDAEHTAEIARLLTPPGMRAEVSVVYQTVDALRAAVNTPPVAESNSSTLQPLHLSTSPDGGTAAIGDWYFTGDYPTPGGYRVLRRSLENHLARREGRSY